MRKTLVFVMILALVTMVFAAMPMKARAPVITKITPSKGMVGKTAVIHGADLRGSSIVVKFGQSKAQDVEPLNDKAVKITIPAKNALDPDPVTVTFTVDGVSAGEVPFSYKILGPEPVVTSVDPPEAQVGTPFSISVTGMYFLTPQGRTPTQIYLFGPTIIEGTITYVPECDPDRCSWDEPIRFEAEFDAPEAIEGDWWGILGFSDSSGAEFPFNINLAPP